MDILKRNHLLCMDVLIEIYHIYANNFHLLCPKMGINFVILIVILVHQFQGKELLD